MRRCQVTTTRPSAPRDRPSCAGTLPVVSFAGRSVATMICCSASASAHQNPSRTLAGAGLGRRKNLTPAFLQAPTGTTRSTVCRPPPRPLSLAPEAGPSVRALPGHHKPGPDGLLVLSAPAPRAASPQQAGHPAVREQLPAGLAGGAVLQGGIGEGDLGHRVATYRAGLPRPAVYAHLPAFGVLEVIRRPSGHLHDRRAQHLT